MKKLLFIDTCIREEKSRTKKLCDVYIEEFKKANPDTEVETVVLRDGCLHTHTMSHLEERDKLIAEEKFDHPMFDMANQFKNADQIVIGAPYWDLSFPAILKVYIENIVASKITFNAVEDHFEGLCKGEELVYITTAGGLLTGQNYGYDYMKGIAKMLGIKSTRCFSCECVDVWGVDVEKVMSEEIERIKTSFQK